MCLRGFRKAGYPNRYAYKIAEKWGEGKGARYTGPYFNSKAEYAIGKTFRAKGSHMLAVRVIPANDPQPYYKIPEEELKVVLIPSGSHLYTRLEEAKKFCDHENTNGAFRRFCVLKCDIAKVVAYGDDAWGRAVVAHEVTPREEVWDREKAIEAGRLKRSWKRA